MSARFEKKLAKPSGAIYQAPSETLPRLFGCSRWGRVKETGGYLSLKVYTIHIQVEIMAAGPWFFSKAAREQVGRLAPNAKEGFG